MSVEKIDGWKCKDCKCLYDDEDEAKCCCGSGYEDETTYICDDCGDKYDDEDDAASCCAAEECEFWECSKCGCGHEDKIDAMKCCGEVDPNDLC